MRRISSTAWWVLPIAVALMGSVAVGAAVNRSVGQRDRELPEVAVPKLAAGGSGAAASPGSVGVVLGGRALVPVPSATSVPPPTAPTQGGPVPVAPPREDGAGQGGQQQAGEPGEEGETTTSTVPPPTVVTVPEDGNEDGKGDDRHDHSSAPELGRAVSGEGD